MSLTVLLRCRRTVVPVRCHRV